MSRPRATFFMLSLAAAVLAGCESAPKIPRPIGASTLTLDQDARRTTARVKLGHEVKIELPAITEAGHVWKIMSADMRFVKQMSVIVPKVEEARPHVSFLMLQTGRTVIRFLVLPATHAAEADPIGSHEVILTIE